MRILTINKHSYPVLFFLLFAGSYPILTAQNYDTQLWSSAYQELQISPKFSATLREEIRFQNNISQLRLISLEISEAYRFNKWFKAGLGYRNIQKVDSMNGGTPVFDTEKKIMMNLYFYHRIGKMTLMYRQRLQYERDHIFSSEQGEQMKWQSRNKITLRYDSLKKITPYFAVELRWQIDNPKLVEADLKWHRARWELGCYYKVSRRSSAGIFALYQHEWNMLPEDQDYLYVVGFTFYTQFIRTKWAKTEKQLRFPDEGPE